MCLDNDFLQFLETLSKEEEKLPSAEIYIEEIEAQKAIDKNSEHQLFLMLIIKFNAYSDIT